MRVLRVLRKTSIACRNLLSFSSNCLLLHFLYFGVGGGGGGGGFLMLLTRLPNHSERLVRVSPFHEGICFSYCALGAHQKLQ